ncbi:hypothetical protein CFC21_077363 [Triticum aestivum]|uniref:PGG domain-containing protein n=3 Tax=Triticinae TaxID=1648030 RepID=A0A9R1HUK4_WHEAT|nr:ankyrin repeat-containing protein At2g01680-like [Triticum aestivum]KAF7072207.1 hypothetical protein CFC21_077363 [Triticum aestivum]
MAPENTEQAPSPRSKPNEGFDFEPHPELLMAARRGDRGQLERLLGQKDDAAAAPQPAPVRPARRDVIVHIEEAVNVESASTVTSADALTMARDSVLHVVSSRGDADQFLKSATVIYDRARHLLDARNGTGDTPLHCAVRAGWGRMVAHLVDLAKAENGGGGGERLKAMLRMQNEQGETVLHEAVRLGSRDMVARLMKEDPELARVPPADGASPLYLAVSLDHDDIARQLYQNDEGLSYSGPDGRNALHVAALKGKGTIKMLLEWNNDLIRQADRSTRSTPLHFAASWGEHEGISLLLDADQSAAYQADSDGSFPIHVAAYANKVKAVNVLLDGRQDCAELHDANGRTFLHVAVLEESQSVVTYACKLQSKKFSSSVMNMQDKDGNTALHLAIQMGNVWIFSPLMKNRKVKLNLRNNKGQTPLDLSWITTPAGVHYGLNPRIMIHKLLQDAGAKNGTFRCDHFHKEHIVMLDPKEEAQKITDSTQTIGIASVLIATVAFTAAFALPGGYRADDHPNGGTPTLARHYAFDVFIIANTLAFISACLSITSLMYAGVTTVDIRTRMISFVISVTFMAGSARSLAAAFVFGLYVVLAAVARTTAIASCAITALALVDAVWVFSMVTNGELMLLKRLGVRAWWRLPRAILLTFLTEFWPYIVIAGVLIFYKVDRVH